MKSTERILLSLLALALFCLGWMLHAQDVSASGLGLATYTSLSQCTVGPVNQAVFCPVVSSGVGTLYVSYNGAAYVPIGGGSAPTTLSCPTWSVSNGQPLAGSGCTIK